MILIPAPDTYQALANFTNVSAKVFINNQNKFIISLPLKILNASNLVTVVIPYITGL